MPILFRKSRRDFLKVSTAAGGGLALQFMIPARAIAAGAVAKGPELTAWLVVNPDNSVVIRVARSLSCAIEATRRSSTSRTGASGANDESASGLGA